MVITKARNSMAIAIMREKDSHEEKREKEHMTEKREKGRMTGKKVTENTIETTDK